jgi:hypothetical protein
MYSLCSMFYILLSMYLCKNICKVFFPSLSTPTAPVHLISLQRPLSSTPPLFNAPSLQRPLSSTPPLFNAEV